MFAARRIVTWATPTSWKHFPRLCIAIGLIGVLALFSGCGSKSTGKSSGDVSGTVKEAITGNPIAGATVTIGGKTAETDMQGKYIISNLAGGSQSGTVARYGYTTKNVSVNVAGNTVYNVELSTTAPRVVLNATSAPNIFALDGKTIVAAQTTMDISGNTGAIVVPRTDGGSTAFANLLVIANAQYFEVPVDADNNFSMTIPLNPGSNYLQLGVETAGGAVGVSEVISFTSQLPRSDIRAVLSWDTNGTDIDIHLFRRTPNPWTSPQSDADWWDVSKHVFFANPAPNDWGNASTQNPTLDIDDVFGYGPETILLPEAASGTYSLWVHYFSDNSGAPAVTPTKATVNLWLYAGTPNQVRKTYTVNLTREWQYVNLATFTLPSGSFGSVFTEPVSAQAVNLYDQKAAAIYPKK